MKLRPRLLSSRLVRLQQCCRRPGHHECGLRPFSSTTTPHSSTSPQSQSAPSQTVFSGIQPTGIPHIGNYLGALRQWVHLQNTVQATSTSNKPLFCIVDLHAITSPSDAVSKPAARAKLVRVEESLGGLRQKKREMLAAFLAMGLDPERSVLFYQSAVPAHSELMWILSCTASMGYLSRMTQWKSKIAVSDDTGPLDEKTKAVLKLGLFSYPVLQAADVLVHRATHVPVGDDQRQHIEFARECATNFNHTYGADILVSPQTIHSPTRRIMSLQDPLKKMSKSDADPRSRILLTDTPEEIRKKVSSALTDSTSNLVTSDLTNRPGVANLIELNSWAMEGQEDHAKTAASFAAEGMTLKDLKAMTASTITRGLSGMRERHLEVLARDGGEYLDRVAERGAEQARASAERTMKDVRSAVGLG